MKSWRAALVPALLLASLPAHGHDLFGSGNDFYNGLAHPFLSLPHVLTALGLGLLVGRHGGERLGVFVAGYMAALVAGLLCATFSLGFAAEGALLLGAALLGLALAADRPLPLAALLPAVLALVLVMGLDFAAEDAGSKVGANLGVGVTLYFLFLVSVGFAEAFGKHAWQRIGLRILGSWMAASALLAFSFAVFVEKS